MQEKALAERHWALHSLSVQGVQCGVDDPADLRVLKLRKYGFNDQ